MKTRFALLIIFIVAGLYGQAQIETILWQNCFGTLNGRNWTKTVERSINGYLFGIDLSEDGPGVSNFHGIDDAWIVNTDFEGNLLWEKCYGGSAGDGSIKIVKITDSLFYLFNQIDSHDGDIQNGRDGNFWIVKINAEGDILWEYSYGGSIIGEEGIDAILMPDNGLLMMGRISSAGGDISTHYGDMDVWLCRIDSVGTILWEKTLGNAWKDNGIKIKLTSRNTILFIGGHEMVGDMIACPDYGYIFTDVWLVELDLHGNILDQWCYGGLYYDLGWDVVETEDGYIIAASTQSNDRDVSGFHGYPGVDFSDIWIFKIDKSGNIIWQKCLGGYSWEYPKYISTTADNGCVVIGYTCSLDGDVSGNHSMYDYYSDIWVVKLNGNGELEWEHCFGGLGTERFWGTNSVLKIDDYNYVIGANSNYLDQDVECDLFPNNVIDYNAWLFEIKDCNYYAPGIPSGLAGPDTLCTVAEPVSLYSTNSAQWAAGYEWLIEPENAGTIMSNDTTAQITWDPQFEGSVSIRSRSYNDCGYSAWSEPFITQVYTCLGTGEYIINANSLIINPNPAYDKVTISIKGKIREEQIEISFLNILGNEVKRGFLSEGKESTVIDISELPAGIYFVTILNEGKRISPGKMVVAR